MSKYVRSALFLFALSGCATVETPNHSQRESAEYFNYESAMSQIDGILIMYDEEKRGFALIYGDLKGASELIDGSQPGEPVIVASDLPAFTFSIPAQVNSFDDKWTYNGCEFSFLSFRENKDGWTGRIKSACEGGNAAQFDFSSAYGLQAIILVKQRPNEKDYEEFSVLDVFYLQNAKFGFGYKRRSE